MGGAGRMNSLYIIWNNPKTKKSYKIGLLSRNNNYYSFSYGYQINEAIKEGFVPFICFDDINKTYNSKKMFPMFSSRLPSKRRKDIRSILDKYGLQEYDEFLLLQKSGGKLPIDNLEFKSEGDI